MRPLEPFDARHPLCVWPIFGQEFSDAFNASHYTTTMLARAVNVRVDAIRAYRRGFSKPSSVNAERLALLLGREFTINETRADGSIKAEALPLIEALKKMGYIVEIRGVAR